MKNVMKKATALLLAVLVVLAFAGCAGKTATPSTDAQKLIPPKQMPPQPKPLLQQTARRLLSVSTAP